MIVQPASNLRPAPVEWLWPGYLAVGSLAIIDGDPDLGKSLITLDLAARLSTGRPWPDGAPSPGPAPVMLLADEDFDNVVLARLTALGACLPRVFPWSSLDEKGLPRVPSDVERIDQALAETAKLLVIDPIMAFLDRGVMTSSDAEVRFALRPMAGLARKRNCVILLVRHLNKRTGGRSLYRGGGSIAFVAACRLAWMVGRDPKHEGQCVLAQAKNNYAAKQPSLAYSLLRDAVGVDWQGPSICTADELAHCRPHPVRHRACEFLRVFLSAGPRLAGEVLAAARRHKISKGTLKLAKKEVGVRYERVCKDGERFDFWLLPGQEVPAELSDTPEADELLRQLGEQWAGQESMGDERAGASCEENSEEI